MKKTIVITAMILSAAASASAQTMDDAINFGQNNYYGTARTIGMANAVTAVGGDLGTVNINPAGSAVAGYSQVALTPGLTISSNLSSYAPSYATYYGGSSSNPLPTTQSYGSDQRQTMTKFALPQVGFAIRVDTGRSIGLRAMSFGVTANVTNYYTDNFSASGTNRGTSMSASFANFATTNADGAGRMMPPDILTRSNPFSSGYYWDYITAYWGGMINYNLDADNYFGSTETVKRTPIGPEEYKYDYYVAGALNQRFSNQATGAKRDLLFNFGFDFNDCLFLGVNIGVPMINYKYNQAFYETADDPDDFPITPEYIGSNGVYVKGNPTYFDNSRYKYFYSSRTRGIYGKFGVIWLPTEDLRLGGAIQTPTAFTVDETWQVGVDTYLYDGSHEYSDSDVGNYRYRLRGPWSFNVGAAYTFGTVGMLSVDYEMTGFGSMAYKSLYSDLDDQFARVNRLCQLFCGPSHSVRVGLEINVLPSLAVRAGYSFKSDPTYSYDSALGKVDAYAYDAFFKEFEEGYYKLEGPKKAGSGNIGAFSLGFGYVFQNAIFADVAVRRTAYPVRYVSPYSVYIDNDEVTVYSPEIRTLRRLWDVALTIGWRF